MVTIILFFFNFQNDPIVSMTASYYNILNNIPYRYPHSYDQIQCDGVNSKLQYKYRQFGDFCLHLTAILKNYDKIRLVGGNSVKCIFLNLWIYEQIYDMPEVHNEDDRQKIMSEIRNFWSIYPKSSNCVIREELSTKQDFLDNKKLFDYTINYRNIEIHIRNEGHKCTKRVKNYLDEIQEIYKRLKAQPRTEKGYNYYNILEDFEKINQYGELLSKFLCPHTINDADTPSTRDEERVSSAGPSVELMEPSVSTGESVIIGQRISRRESGYPELQGPQHSPEMSEVAEAPLTIALTGGIPFIGVATISYLLYKFTPVGSLLYPRVQKIKNTIQNIIRGRNEVKQDIYNFYPPYMDINRFNIEYQSR
ncbi:CYIR protein [Plasmodium cynomolgi strain B]|uniref:CYIR protein n=1 Tax=Plasmodium cynomolgi (strain B) TaxID=1120755 RepID=K6UNG8_PLACD|nr:CYIR protein [Plasmodium cynomolgi strain B]GAB69473.1 CYIR protein [Plasmodium cynomolgi strain B]